MSASFCNHKNWQFSLANAEAYDDYEHNFGGLGSAGLWHVGGVLLYAWGLEIYEKRCEIIMAMNREIQEYNQRLLGAETFADLSEKKYEKRLGKLRADLMKAQRKLRDAPNPVVIVIAGVDGAGKGQAIQLLSEWLDPRDLSAHSFWNLSEEALQRPRFWRYWNALPRRGKLSLWFGGWYSALLADGVDQRLSKAEWEENLKDIQNQELALTTDGAVLLKFWFHLTKYYK